MAFLNPAHTEVTYDGRVYPSPQIQDKTAEAMEWLCTSVSLMSELVLTDPELSAMSSAMKSDDAIEFLRVYRAAMDRHVEDELDELKDRADIKSDLEAAYELMRIHA